VKRCDEHQKELAPREVGTPAAEPEPSRRLSEEAYCDDSATPIVAQSDGLAPEDEPVPHCRPDEIEDCLCGILEAWSRGEGCLVCDTGWDASSGRMVRMVLAWGEPDPIQKNWVLGVMLGRRQE
jgi:hypothetical protein